MTSVGTPAAFAGALGAARTRLTVLGLPTVKDEAWRYVDLKPLASPPTGPSRPVTDQDVAAHRLAGCDLLVLVDGAVRTDLGDRIAEALPLADLPASEARTLDEEWARNVAATDDISQVWSLADYAGGLRLRLASTRKRPIQILSLATGGASACQLVIEAGRGCEASVVITHLALGPARSSVGIQVELTAGAILRVDELQYGISGQVYSLARTRLGRDAHLAWTSCWLGGDLVRQRFAADLVAPNARLDLSGIAALDGTRQAHQYLRVHHRAGQATSSQLVRNIADGRAVASFDGLIAVAVGADGTDAIQTNKNLLLSAGARIDTRPQLDIAADDVKAAHGATVGQLAAEELFYLRTRGLDLTSARALLIHGFALEILDRFSHPAARQRATEEVLTVLRAAHD